MAEPSDEALNGRCAKRLAWLADLQEELEPLLDEAGRHARRVVDDYSIAAGFWAMPEAPAFPVYGLAPSFAGSRVLVMWQAPPPQRLYSVDLLHGHPDLSVGPTAVVCTVAVRPRERTRGAIGIEDATLGALLRLHHAQPAPVHGKAEVDALVALSQHREPPEWSTATGHLDGHPQVFAHYRRGRLWVAVCDGGPVAVSVVGHGLELEDLELQQVNSGLQRYAIT